MKYLLAFFTLSFILLQSCTSTSHFYNQPDNDIRYYQTTISNVDRNIITTASGDVWVLNSVLTGKQRADILLMFNLFDDYEGKAIINGTL